MSFFGNSGGFGGPSWRSSGGGIGGFDGWKIDMPKGPSFSSFGTHGFSSQAAAPKLFSPPSGMSFGARGSMGAGTALAARESMAGFSSGPSFGSSSLSVQVPSSVPCVEISAPKPSSVPRAATRSAMERMAGYLQPPGREHLLWNAKNTARRAMAQSMPTVAGNSVKHGAANFQESAVANDLGSKIAEFSQPNLSSAERGNLHHSEKLVDEIPAGRPEITPPKESPEQAKSFCESAKATESMAAGGTNSDALESKPSFWKSGLESLGKHILDEEVITGDPVRDWDIRQQAGVQDVKTILTAATILAPGLGIGGKVAAGGIKCALAGGAVKVAAGGAKSMVKTAVAKVPGGPTLATPNGAPMVCAMEAAPALGIASTTAEGSAAAATKALLPVLQLSKEIGGDGAALFAKRDGKSAEKPQNTSQLGGTGPSGGTDPSKKPEGGRERKVDTPEMRNEFVREKEKSSEWIRHRVIDDKQTWRNGDKTQYFQKTIEKNEIEVYTKRGKHMGVIKPSDGQLRPELKVDGREINLK